MNTQAFARPHFVTFAAVAFAIVIAVTLLSTLTGAFRQDGTPFEQVVEAQRACASRAYVSERETCQREYLAARQVGRVAAR